MAVPPPAPAAGEMMSTTGNSSDKSLLRSAMRNWRLVFAQTSQPILPPAALLSLMKPPGIIAGYVPMAGEADPALISQAAMAMGFRLALPHVTVRTAPMRFLSWMPGDPLVDGPFGLRQPRADAAELTPDVVLTPLLAFDSALNRLGQGAGYYDRAFATLPAVLRIGVAWSIQQVDTLPTQPWDVPLHGIVTETGWIEPETTP